LCKPRLIFGENKLSVKNKPTYQKSIDFKVKLIGTLEFISRFAVSRATTLKYFNEAVELIISSPGFIGQAW